MGSSPGELSEELVMQEKRKKGWRINCDIGETTAVANPDEYFRYTASFICHNVAHNCNSCMSFIDNFS